MFACLPRLAYNSLMESELDVRPALYNNIVTVGGNSSFCGLTNRLAQELMQLLPKTNIKVKVKAHARAQRTDTIWMGGSILASLSSSKTGWMSKKDYEENGSLQMIVRNRTILK